MGDQYLDGREQNMEIRLLSSQVLFRTCKKQNSGCFQPLKTGSSI